MEIGTVKYIVKLNYLEYVFDNSQDAVNFATTALTHASKEYINVEIELKWVKKEED